MSVVTRSLDDIDRLAFRLSRTVRTQYPQLLTTGFTLTDLEERLLPFRDARREMANGGMDAFEIAMLRLISGERGYVDTDVALQQACRQALALPSPTLALVRSWSTTSVRLTGPPANPHTTDTIVAEDVFGGASGAPAHGAPANRSLVTAARTTATSPQAAGCGCRFCGNRLPDHRRLTFCPYCGTDLTKRQCAACSTELDIAWRFCVTCGRGADVPDLPPLPQRAAS